METSLLLNMLYQKRKNMSAANRKKSKGIRKGIKLLYPLNIEKKYYNIIKTLLKKITDYNTSYIRENIARWIEEYNRAVNDGAIKLDAYPEDLRIHIEDLEEYLNQLYKTNGEQIRTLITDIGFDISEFNSKQWGKLTESLVGVEIIGTELWETEVIKAWAENNFNLIKSLNQEYIKKVNTIVSDAVTTGRTSGYLVKQPTFKEIEQKVFRDLKKWNKHYAEYRTRLIARDQVGKLNGQITQRRMTDAGIDMYIWLTAGDERVRGNPSGRYKRAVPSHYIMPGSPTANVYRWDNPNVYSTDGGKTWKPRTAKMEKQHPGQAIRCRCTALPYMDDIIKEMDKLIKNEERRAA